MQIIKTKYGNLANVTVYDRYSNGRVKTVNTLSEHRLNTQWGTLIPRYKADVDSQRHKKDRHALSFYSNGHLKRIELEEQTDIQTPLGLFKAELMTFYEDGSLHRIFPLNGKIDGYWTESDERQRAQSYTVKVGAGEITAAIMGLRFYPSGKLRSILFWPEEQVAVNTPIGNMVIRQGLSFYEDGSIESVEPAFPMYVNTPVGFIEAFDPYALGVHADENSLSFDEAGQIKTVSTISCSVHVVTQSGVDKVISPKVVASYTEVSETTVLPLVIQFDHDTICLDGDITERISSTAQFRVMPYSNGPQSCFGSCSSCSGCGTS